MGIWMKINIYLFSEIECFAKRMKGVKSCPIAAALFQDSFAEAFLCILIYWIYF